MNLRDDERLDALYANDIQIIQSPSVFSFSLDAVLLANFPRIPKRGTVVDLCAGNGAVGLFIAKKTMAKIHQIEIQERLADMGQRSITLNQLTDQVTMHHLDLKETFSLLPKESCDLVLCNPPYFKSAPLNKTNPNEHLALARHEITTNLQEVVTCASQLLKMKGHFALVHRPERLLDILAALKAARLAPKRIQFVYPKAEKDANILLVEAIKDGKEDGLKILPPLVVYDEHDQYQPAIKELLYGQP